MARKRKDLATHSYQQNRKAFLAEWDGPCHWCKRAKAVEIDHVIPVAAGIDPTDKHNWVGACQKCNARRGANFIAQKRAGIVKARERSQKNAPAFFGEDESSTPTPMFRISTRCRI